MFAIGETKGIVHFSKLELPKEYHLRKKKLTAVWIGKNVLYLSDEPDSLKRKAGKEGLFFDPDIDSLGRIEVPHTLEGKMAYVKGCISTIRITFKD
ncbi:hypothetical protein lbkm_0085 [Lachnospiraceae bacterium KM106-2]|nr:hypothetical protein lbkm_0085 [Lachnospiraceae bacterium KM106-2]